MKSHLGKALSAVANRYTRREIAIILSLIWLLVAIGASVYRFTDLERFKVPVSDFLAFYAASDLVQEGRSQAPYDLKVYVSRQQGYFPQSEVKYGWFYTPATYFLIYPLAWLPMLPSFALFCLLGILALWFACRFALGDKRFGEVWPFVFACSAWSMSVIFGQMTPLLIAAVLMGLGNLLRGRQVVAGLWLGLLILKPQYGILLPVLLLARGAWKTIAVTALTAGFILLLSWLAFGAESWRAFYGSTDFTGQVLEQGKLNTKFLVSVFEMIRQTGAPVAFAWAAQSLAIALAGAGVWMAARRWPLPLACAGYCMATLFASPWLHSYDLSWLQAMLVFLLAGWRPEQEPKAHIWALSLVWVLPFGLSLVPAPRDLSFGAAWLLLPAWLLWRLGRDISRVKSG